MHKASHLGKSEALVMIFFNHLLKKNVLIIEYFLNITF